MSKPLIHTALSLCCCAALKVHPGKQGSGGSAFCRVMVATVNLVLAQTMLASDFKVVGYANWPLDQWLYTH